MGKIINFFLGKINLLLIKKKSYDQILKKINDITVFNLMKVSKKNNLENIIKNIRFSKSQLAQDLFVLNELNFKKNGFFVEFGACDGVLHSNTHILEKKFDWKGILCEPANSFLEILKVNRNCHIENRCVYSASEKVIDFTEFTDEGELSGLGIIAIENIFKKKKTYKVQTISLNDLLQKYSCPKNFDYLSIDTEGSEFEIINNLDFARFRPKIISIEHNYNINKREDIYSLLSKKHYERVYTHISDWDDWYIEKNV